MFTFEIKHFERAVCSLWCGVEKYELKSKLLCVSSSRKNSGGLCSQLGQSYTEFGDLRQPGSLTQTSSINEHKNKRGHLLCSVDSALVSRLLSIQIKHFGRTIIEKKNLFHIGHSSECTCNSSFISSSFMTTVKNYLNIQYDGYDTCRVPFKVSVISAQMAKKPFSPQMMLLPVLCFITTASVLSEQNLNNKTLICVILEGNDKWGILLINVEDLLVSSCNRYLIFHWRHMGWMVKMGKIVLFTTKGTHHQTSQCSCMTGGLAMWGSHIL